MKRKTALLSVIAVILCLSTSIFAGGSSIDASFRKIYSMAYAYPEGSSGGQNIELSIVESLQAGTAVLTAQPVRNTEKYGYADLAKRSNAEARQRLYDLLAEQAADVHEAKVNIGSTRVDGKDYYFLQKYDLAEIGVSINEAVEVWVTFKNDHPEYYWISNECVTSESDNTFCMLVYSDYALAESRKDCNKLIADELAKYVILANKCNSKLEMAVAVHDEICKNTEYAMVDGSPSVSAYAHNILGVFENGSAVCEGYAKAYQYILTELGIENIYVTGTATSASGTENHAWNLVKLDDGKWYNIDITWDDTSVANETVYYYFGATKATFESNHTANTPSSAEAEYFLYDIPEASSTPCSLVALYKNDEKIRVCFGLENAFAYMEDSTADYTVELFKHTQVFAIGDKTPNVNGLTIKGNCNSDTGVCDKIYVVGNVLRIGSNIILENVELTYDPSVATPSCVDIGTSKITFCGEKSQCNIDISGKESGVVEVSTNKKPTFININVKNLVLATKSVDFGTSKCIAENITIKDGVTDIGTEMLAPFAKAKRINIPQSVTFISVRAFDNNTSLDEISVDKSNMAYSSVDGILYALSSTGAKLVRCPINKVRDTLDVTNALLIEENAFKSVNGIKTVIIRNGCTAIRDKAFAQINATMLLYIPSCVTSIASNAFDKSTGITVYCKYGSLASEIPDINKQSVNEFIYRFLDHDGSLIVSVTDYENSVIVKPSDPTRAADSMYEYAFSHWVGYTAGMQLTSDCDLTASYTSTLRKYKVEFLDADGKPISSRMVNAGSVVQLPDSTPTKDPTAEFEYTFSAWSGYITDESGEMKVLKDLTFTPTFNETKRKYKYTFYDEDGETVLASGILEHGTPIPLPDEPVKEHFVFSKWQGYTEKMTLKKDETFVAVYDIREYEYIFYDEDGETVLANGKLTYSSTIPLPDEPKSKTGPDGKEYVFARWVGYEPDMQISEDIYFVAEYKTNVLKYRFLNYNGDVIAEDALEEGQVIPSPDSNLLTWSKPSTAQYYYVFTGWSGYTEGMTISENVDFTAQYDPVLQNYEYIFRDEDGTDLKKEKVPYGTVIVPPEYTVNDEPGYKCEFIGWNGYSEGMMLESNRIFTVNIKRTPLVCNIVFKNYDGSVFDEKEVAVGTPIILPALKPQRDGYKFTGWRGYTAGMLAESDTEFMPEFELSEKGVLSDVYKVGDGMIYGVDQNTTVEQFKSNLKNEFDVKIYDKNNTEITDGNICVTTYSVVRLYSDDPDEILQELIIVVRGDINGDGKVSITDFVKIKSQLISDGYLTDKVQLMAADHNCDGKISITDFVQIKALCLNS